MAILFKQIGLLNLLGVSLADSLHNKSLYIPKDGLVLVTYGISDYSIKCL